MKVIQIDADNIKVEGHKGTWYVIDSTIKNSIEYFLLESEQFGEEANCLIVDSLGRLIREDVTDGFNEL